MKNCLKNCGTEESNTGLWKCDAKKFRKYKWMVAEATMCLPLVSYLKVCYFNFFRYLIYDYLNWGLTRVVDCNQATQYLKTVSALLVEQIIAYCIQEPTLFNPKWYSQKFHSARLRFEVCVGHRKGNKVWVYGPFPWGSWPNVMLFKSKMVSSLTKNIEWLLIVVKVTRGVFYQLIFLLLTHVCIHQFEYVTKFVFKD